MTSDVESVVEVVDHIENTVLVGIARQKRRRLIPNPFEGIGALPSHWWPRGIDAAGNVQIGVYPPPSTDRTYMLEEFERPRFPSADGDELEVATGIPVRFHPVIVARGKIKAFEIEDEGELKRGMAEREYSQGISAMKQFGEPGVGASLQVRSNRATDTRAWDFDAYTDIDGV